MFVSLPEVSSSLFWRLGYVLFISSVNKFIAVSVKKYLCLALAAIADKEKLLGVTQKVLLSSQNLLPGSRKVFWKANKIAVSKAFFVFSALAWNRKAFSEFTKSFC